MRNLLTVSVLATSLAAQTITTAPAGFENTRGTGSVLYPFSATLTPAGSFRYQEVHTSLRGTTLNNIVAANFRRDESATATATAVARTGNIEFVLGTGDVQTFTPDFAANFSGGRSVVFVRKPVNLVSWVGPGNGTLEAWSNRLPFDTPFSYAGTADLLWEVSYDSMTPTGTYNSDRSAGGGSLWTSASGTNIGTGCTATGRTTPFLLNTTLYHHVGSQLLRLQYWVTNGPSTTPAVMNIDTVNSNLSAPFLCGTLIALPTLSLPIGVTSTTGATPTLNYLSFPYNPSFLSNSLFMQALAPDAGQSQPFLPLVLSQGEDCRWPAVNVPTPASTSYIYNADLTAQFGNGPFFAGSVITGLEQ